MVPQIVQRKHVHRRLIKPSSLHAVMLLIDSMVQGMSKDDDSVEGKRCTSFSFRHNSIRGKLSSPQGKGTSKARGSGSTRTSLGMRLLGSLRTTRPSRRNSMGGHSSTDGPPRTASGGGELEGAGSRAGIGDDSTADGGAARGSGAASRESDRVLPFNKHDTDAQYDSQGSGARTSHHTDVIQRNLVGGATKDQLTGNELAGLRLKGTSAEAPSSMHAWRGSANNTAAGADRKASISAVAAATAAVAAAAAAAAAARANVNDSLGTNQSADTSSVVVEGTGSKAAAGEGWETGFKERRRVVGGSVAAPASSSIAAGLGAAGAAATASGALPQLGMGLSAAGIEAGPVAFKGLGGLSGSSLGSMAPGERLKRLKSHRDRSARVSITKQISDVKLKDFAMEVVGGGVQGTGSKIKP